MNQPQLSIIIPAYMEAARIEQTLHDLAEYLKEHHHTDVEVLVVVAESSDGTADLAQSKAKLFRDFRVVHSGPKVGKGRDVRTGMMEARGQYKLFMDADLATPLHYIEDVYRNMHDGAEVIIAVRDLTSSHTGLRKLVSSLGNGLVQLLLLPGISDTQCGFKAFSAKAADELFRRQTILGWGFDMEILAIARLLKYRIVQIKVPDWSDKPDGTFEAEVGSAAIETLGELFSIVGRRLTGKYKNKHYEYRPYQS